MFHFPRQNTFTSILILFCLFLFSCKSTERPSCVYDPVNSNVRNFTSLKHNKVTGLNIHDGMFKGLLEYLPKGYNANDTTELYPVIIYFHGVEARGQGTEQDLCKILWDGITGTGSSLPPLIEMGGMPEKVNFGNKDYEFLVISPQFTMYEFPVKFPSIDEVDAVVDYILSNYRVDPKRIYLTGMSTGANMVIEYAGSKLSKGKIAAVSTASLCDSVGIPSNVNRDINPENIASNGHGVWFLQCLEDDRCSPDISKAWHERIQKAGGRSRITLLDNNAEDPMFHCARFEHNTWFRMYDPEFKVDGMNLYEWFLSCSANQAAN